MYVADEIDENIKVDSIEFATLYRHLQEYAAESHLPGKTEMNFKWTAVCSRCFLDRGYHYEGDRCPPLSTNFNIVLFKEHEKLTKISRAIYVFLGGVIPNVRSE